MKARHPKKKLEDMNRPCILPFFNETMRHLNFMREEDHMTKAEYKDFQSSDEIRTFEKGKLEILNIGTGTIGRLTLEPGWRWADHVKPIAKTQWCEAPHFQYQLSGRLHILMEDGTQFESVSGQVSYLPAGHDAWVVGDEAVVLIDWSGAHDYAKKKD